LAAATRSSLSSAGSWSAAESLASEDEPPLGLPLSAAPCPEDGLPLAFGGAGGTGGNGTYLAPYGGSGGAGGFGGGIYNGSSSSVQLRDTVVALNSSGLGGVPGIGEVDGNFGPTNSAVDLSGAFFSSGFNLIGQLDRSAASVSAGTSDLLGTLAHPINPRLTALQTNDGPMLTFAPMPGSPLIDAGDDRIHNYYGREQEIMAIDRFSFYS